MYICTSPHLIERWPNSSHSDPRPSLHRHRLQRAQPVHQRRKVRPATDGRAAVKIAVNATVNAAVKIAVNAALNAAGNVAVNAAVKAAVNAVVNGAVNGSAVNGAHGELPARQLCGESTAETRGEGQGHEPEILRHAHKHKWYIYPISSTDGEYTKSTRAHTHRELIRLSHTLAVVQRVRHRGVR